MFSFTPLRLLLSLCFFCTSLLDYKSLFLKKIHCQNYCCYVKSKAFFLFLPHDSFESSKGEKKNNKNYFSWSWRKQDTNFNEEIVLKVVILGERLKEWLLSQCEGNKHFHFQLALTHFLPSSQKQTLWLQNVFFFRHPPQTSCRLHRTLPLNKWVSREWRKVFY